MKHLLLDHLAVQYYNENLSYILKVWNLDWTSQPEVIFYLEFTLISYSVLSLFNFPLREQQNHHPYLPRISYAINVYNCNQYIATIFIDPPKSNTCVL